MSYEYECWKCNEWHAITAEAADLQRIAEDTGAAIRSAETKVIVIGGRND